MKTKEKANQKQIEMSTEKKAENAEKRPSNLMQNANSAQNDVSERGFTPRIVRYLVNDKGEVQWDRMQNRTKEDLKDFVNRPESKKHLGLEREVAAIDIPVFDEDEANSLLDFLETVDGVAASKIYGVPREVTSVAFTFTPEHRKKLNPRIVRLLNKWGPMFLKTWKDEFGLGMVLISVLSAQARKMDFIMEQRKLGIRVPPPVRPSPPPAPTPIDATSKPAPKKDEPLPGDSVTIPSPQAAD